MKFHRYRCFGAWPYRYAYGVAYSSPRDSNDQDGETPTWYAHREHRHRGRRSGSFGVRRPLRYLSYQLDLDNSQRRKIAALLDSVKVEREQAALDEKKMVSDLADLVTGPEISSETLEAALSARVRSAERLQARTAEVLREIVAALDPDQTEEFAYLLRTGAFRI